MEDVEKKFIADVLTNILIRADRLLLLLNDHPEVQAASEIGVGIVSGEEGEA